jgi:hypothetical protein
MSYNIRGGGLALGVTVVALTLGANAVRAQEGTHVRHYAAQEITVDAEIALHSLISLGDGHLQKTADVLTLLAGTEAARSADWERVGGLLAESARLNVAGIHWFALPDGTYWSLEQGRMAAKLSDRPYFSVVLAGRTVIGDLIVSRTSNRNSAVVAVPVRGRDGSIVGVLGNSVDLERLSALVRQEMGGFPDGLFFFAIDAEPLGALHSDPTLIFTEPMKLGDEGMRSAFTQILANREGVVTYEFRGANRTVLYQRSPVTGWWYGFGVVER